MNYKNLLLACVLLLGSPMGFSQSSESYRIAPLQEGANFFEIVEAQRAALAPLLNNTDRASKKKIKQFERWASFWSNRVNSDGTFRSEKHTLAAWESEVKRNGNGQLPGLKAGNWSFVGPIAPPISTIDNYAGMGRLNALAIHPTNSNIMYVGSPSGGVWKTTNGGNTWAPKGDNLPNMGVSSIVIDKNSPNTIYIATGDYDGVQNRSIGVLKSTNGGDSWQTTGLNTDVVDDFIISKLIIDPNNTNVVFATGSDGIYRTTNGGTSWSNVFDIGFLTLFNDILYKPGNSTEMYASDKYGYFYKSTDNGSSWTEVAQIGNGRVDLAISPADANSLYALDSEGNIGVSSDGGETWSAASQINGYSSQDGYNMAIAVSPLNANLILVGGVNGFRSTDGGNTWEMYMDGYWSSGAPSFYVHSDHHDMVFAEGSNIAFSLNDGGINTGDASQSILWQDLSSGLAITQYYGIAGTPQQGNYLIMGAQDNDAVFYNGSTWKAQNPSSDGIEGLWDYSNTDIAWSSSQQGILSRTINGFASQEDLTSAVTQTAPFVWDMMIHPSTPTTIYGGFDDIYESTNRGDSWSSLNSGVGTIEGMTISKSNPDVIFVSGENGDFKKTANGGSTWANVTLPQSGIVKSIEIHPTDPSRVFIAFKGYAAGKVYSSNNGGDSWVDLTGSLPNIPTHKILYKTGSADDLLVLATDMGVYFRNNTSADWFLIGGMPNVIVHDLEIHYASEKLRAATFGRGVWEMDISGALIGLNENMDNQGSLTVFPNPTLDQTFTIELNDLDGESHVVVYNLIGRVVKEFTTKEKSVLIDLKGQHTGMYIVKVRNRNQEITEKVTLK
ncbi:MAG: xyloglucan-specific exo-beta-1,4-glucanase [Sphingobacteriales bacterium]|jgi:xyloglucan-specific exo-beta-1,4-glucanase